MTSLQTSDNSTSITSSVSFPTRRREIPVTFFGDNDSARPTLLLLPDVFGLDDNAKIAAQRLADCGYNVAALDLFAAQGAFVAGADAAGGAKTENDAAPTKSAPSESALADFAETLSDAQIIEDILAALDGVVGRADLSRNSIVKAGTSTRIGIVGWGWSGAFALMAAAYDSRFEVVADIGGAITYPVQTAARPGSPLNFLANLEGALFAAFAGADSNFPASEIERLRAQMQNHDKRGEVKVYDAPARFWRDETLPQTAHLWRRLEAFLREHLLEDGEVQDELGDPNEASRLHA